MTILNPMRFVPKRALFSVILVFALIAILVILAVLQYRWSGQVSRAERERMQNGLMVSMGQFRQEFNSELQQICLDFQPDQSTVAKRDWQLYSEKCMRLIRGTEYQSVGGIYLWLAGADGGSTLQELDRNLGMFEATAWPSRLERVRDRYQRNLESPSRLPAELRPFSWTLISGIPVLIHPLLAPPALGSAQTGSGLFLGYLMIELHLDMLRQEILPQLAMKHFGAAGSLVYEVAIISGRDPYTIIYQSDPDLPASAFVSPDARINLFDNPRNRLGRRGGGAGGEFRFPAEDGQRAAGVSGGPEPARQGRGRGGGPFLVIGGEGTDWELVARHHEGSLETVVTEQRRRNLAISFGILLLLATSMALIIAFAQRTHRLAQLQMDFVAGVSHELRTPLAVICSAGDNLADGIVPESGPQIRQYGELIRDEGRRLAEMVQQVLQFASVQSGRRKYTLRPARIGEIIATALEQARPMIEAAGFTVESDVRADLPVINVDAAALSRCIQNLIHNAIKYSSESKWMAIRVIQTNGDASPWIQTTVEDHGMGIEADDLPHIFEPFYRGRGALSAQIHGTGLGLFMARETIQAMGGRIDVESAPGRGSIFTILLPAVSADAAGSVGADLSHRN